MAVGVGAHTTRPRSRSFLLSLGPAHSYSKASASIGPSRTSWTVRKSKRGSPAAASACGSASRICCAHLLDLGLADGVVAAEHVELEQPQRLGVVAAEVAHDLRVGEPEGPAAGELALLVQLQLVYAAQHARERVDGVHERHEHRRDLDGVAERRLLVPPHALRPGRLVAPGCRPGSPLRRPAVVLIVVSIRRGGVTSENRASIRPGDRDELLDVVRRQHSTARARRPSAGRTDQRQRPPVCGCTLSADRSGPTPRRMTTSKGVSSRRRAIGQPHAGDVSLTRPANSTGPAPVRRGTGRHAHRDDLAGPRAPGRCALSAAPPPPVPRARPSSSSAGRQSRSLRLFSTVTPASSRSRVRTGGTGSTTMRPFSRVTVTCWPCVSLVARAMRLGI